MKIIVIAGPNGAGKTTFAREYLMKEVPGLRFVNGDDIAAELNPGDPDAAAQQAGRIALRRMDAYVANREDFAIETTLSGRAYVGRIRQWQARGYRVAVVYLRLPSADIAVERVAQRVREGGHRVPESVIRRRFERSWPNFLALYRHVANELRVYDNSGETPILMAESEDWPGVRESPPGWSPSDDRHPGPTRKTGDCEYRYARTERTLMTEKPGRIPEGEPSNERVLASLVRARDQALARAMAARGIEPHQESTGENTGVHLQADGGVPGQQGSISGRPQRGSTNE